jgi:PKD repeat protein
MSLLVLARLAALLMLAATPARAVDLGPAPGTCPSPHVGPYPARHDFCVRTSSYGSLSVTPDEVGDGAEFQLTLSLTIPRCTVPTAFPCVDETNWGAGDAVGTGPSYRLVLATHTYYRDINGKLYYYVPFDTETVATNPTGCNASSTTYATDCRYRISFNNPTAFPVPTAWAVWNMTLDVRTSATTTQKVWLEAASRVVGQAMNQPPTAAFTWQVRDDDPLAVDFDASGSRDDKGIVSYQWDFGDQTSGSGETTAHTFAEVGSYQVTLTVTDTQGAKNQITWPVMLTPPLEVTLDGAQVPVGDLLELEMRVTNNGMLAMNALEFPDPPVGLRVLHRRPGPGEG